MDKLVKKICPKAPTHKLRNRAQGLTLIEVLIALAIIAIALTAVIKATAQNIRGTNHIQQKVIALWVAENVMNQTRLGLIHAPSRSDSLRSSTEQLGRMWYWQLKSYGSPNPHIQKIKVSIYNKSPDEEDDSLTPVLELEGFINRET